MAARANFVPACDTGISCLAESNVFFEPMIFTNPTPAHTQMSCALVFCKTTAIINLAMLGLTDYRFKLSFASRARQMVPPWVFARFTFFPMHNPTPNTIRAHHSFFNPFFILFFIHSFTSISNPYLLHLVSFYRSQIPNSCGTFSHNYSTNRKSRCRTQH
jgi:hypothetical protein